MVEGAVRVTVGEHELPLQQGIRVF
ncbi:MAG: hypothetical protein ACLSX2_00170 [Christensenellaceae bacterium]